MGFASIHEHALITQFSLSAPARRFGQQAFARLRRSDHVRSALVPTGDEFFLAHALDDHRNLTLQAYFFAAGTPAPPVRDISLRPAVAEDADLVRRESGDFFDDIEHHIAERGLFVTVRGDEPVGFGILVTSALYDAAGSIGMFTLEHHRRTGVATATLSLLRAECAARGLRAVAGCWYYNHRSKQTLERAGMVASTRLLRVEY